MQTTSALWKRMAASAATTDAAKLHTKAVIGQTEYASLSPPVVRRGLMDGGVTIGNCVSASLTLELSTANTVEDNIPRSSPVRLMMWWEDGAGNVSEALPAGTFFVAHRQYDTQVGRMTLECYDAMLKANAGYDQMGIESWPVSMADAVAAIAAAMGVEVDSRTLLRTDWTIPEPQTEATMRDVLSGIAAIHGGNWYITPQGKLRLMMIPMQAPGTESDWHTADTALLRGAVGSVRYDVVPGLEEDRRFRVTGLLVQGDDGATLMGSDDGIVVTVDTPYANENRLWWLKGMLVDSGTHWYPSVVEGAIYDPAVELGDWVEYWVRLDAERDEWTNVWWMICSETITLSSAPRGDLAMPEPGEVADEYPYISTAARQTLRISRKVASLQGRLDALGDPVALAHGGTGADTAAGALAALGVFDAVYPVGSIYMSVNSANPGALFGGTWERLKDRFLLAAGDSYAAGATGGEASHRLTAAESGVPAHAHGLNSHKHSVGAHSHGLNSHRHTYDKPNTPTGSTAITVDQMPSHNHTVPTESNGAEVFGWTTGNPKRIGAAYTQNINTGSTGGGKGHTHTIGTTSTNTGTASGNTANSSAFDSGAASGNTANNTAADASSAHNNMPPYLAVYVWKRTA